MAHVGDNSKRERTSELGAVLLSYRWHMLETTVREKELVNQCSTSLIQMAHVGDNSKRERTSELGAVLLSYRWHMLETTVREKELVN